MSSPPQFHPYADLFPLLEGEEFEALVADIKASGLRQPIVEYEGLILDGRNRYRACSVAGVECPAVNFDGDDPLAFVISQNVRRRHLNDRQRMMIAAKLATMPAHRPASKSANSQTLTQPTAAQMFKVSERGVQQAKVVRERGTPELVKRVESGDIAMSIAEQLACLPPEEQRRIADADEATLRGAAKRHRRARREAELAEAVSVASAALGAKLYGIIYADPPWRFEPYSRKTGMDRAADNHYPTMTLDQLAAIELPAAPDCVLFLWATGPMSEQAHELMRRWGFEYRSQCLWVKDRIGTGYWFRSKHELLLVGTRGSVPAPAPGEQYPSVIEAPVGEHSAKPEAFAEIIEEMFPNAALLEMFARAPRLGWDAWGNEATADATSSHLSDADTAISPKTP
jgi:N6-adenosine-specific RNA methylase IME4/ParB-like chromosome segregation protein Spo0J